MDIRSFHTLTGPVSFPHAVFQPVKDVLKADAAISEIIRFVPGFPLDVATHAGYLKFGSRLAGDHRLQRGDTFRLRRDQLHLLPDQRITRNRGRLPSRHTAHRPQSSRETTLTHHGNTTPDAGT